MTQEKILLKPDTLWTRVKQRTQTALQCGALKSIPTEFELVEQDGINFLVRILVNLDLKKAATEVQEKQTRTTGKEFNPFLPYEEDLFVADISNTHLCILNKFNVVEHHLLIITRAFESQENLLTVEDFAAMWTCLATNFRGLVFYNGGRLAGASQRHKHLQIIPLPLAEGIDIPIAPLFSQAKFQGAIATIPRLPFLHAFTQLDSEEDAETILEKYHSLLTAVGMEPISGISMAYNLLATREWMLIVRRSQESFQSISVNSLGFAGALLVRNPEEMQILKQIGPMNLLRNVGFPIY
jgi:ATP adenylyltransferase